MSQFGTKQRRELWVVFEGLRTADAVMSRASRPVPHDISLTTEDKTRRLDSSKQATGKKH